MNFSVAINDSYKNKTGERVELTTFYNCDYWISPNVANSLTKGTLVELTGRASASGWIGKDGEIRSGLNFHTSNIKFHSSGNKSETVERTTVQPKKDTLAEDENDDLPF